MAKEVYRRGQSEPMDENRTCDWAYANHQWKQDRELMILRHLSTTGILSTPDHDALGFGTNSVWTAVTGAALRPVQTVADYTTIEIMPASYCDRRKYVPGLQLVMEGELPY